MNTAPTAGGIDRKVLNAPNFSMPCGAIIGNSKIDSATQFAM
jgi:hypothetical protein